MICLCLRSLSAHLVHHKLVGSSGTRALRWLIIVYTQCQNFPPSTGSQNPWVIWNKEEMAILGEDVTTERKLAAIETAQKSGRLQRTGQQKLVPVPVVREAPGVSRNHFKPYQEHTGAVERFFQNFKHQCKLLQVLPTDGTRLCALLVRHKSNEDNLNAFHLNPSKAEEQEVSREERHIAQRHQGIQCFC